MKIEPSFRLPDAAQDSGSCSLGSGLRYCVHQVRGIVKVVGGMELRSIYRPARGIDVRSMALDNARLNVQLSGQPGIGQAHGMERTREWLQQA